MARYIELDKAHELVRMAKQYFWSSPVSTETHHTVDVDDIQFGLDKLPTVDAHQWISVKERLPEPEKDVLVAWKAWNGKLYVSTAFYENGNVNTEDSDYAWNDDCDFSNYDEEADAYIIPEGWYESARFAEMFGVVDMVVTHWMPLPEPPKIDTADEQEQK